MKNSLFCVFVILFGCTGGTVNKNLIQTIGVKETDKSIIDRYRNNKDTTYLYYSSFEDDPNLLFQLLPKFSKLQELFVVDTEERKPYLDSVFKILSKSTINRISINCVNLKSLPNSISNIPTLKEIRIEASGEIKNWDAITQCRKLESLELLGITDFPKDLGCLINLKSFFWKSWTYPNITPDYLCDFINIEELDLSYRELDEIPICVFSLSKHSLLRLNMSNNNIRNLPSDLSGLSNLKYLNISSNPIIYNDTEINRLIKSLSNCKVELNAKCI